MINTLMSWIIIILKKNQFLRSHLLGEPSKMLFNPSTNSVPEGMKANGIVDGSTEFFRIIDITGQALLLGGLNEK